MRINRGSLFSPWRSDRSFAFHLLSNLLCLVAALVCLAPAARAQELASIPARPSAFNAPETPSATAQPETPPSDSSAELFASPAPENPIPAELSFDATSQPLPEIPLPMSAAGGKTKKPKPPVETDIVFEGLVSYGNWQIFAAGVDAKLFNAGVELDRHIWGHFAGARMDYVAEVLPFLLMDAPAVTDRYGNPRSKKKILVPGAGFSPIGLRMQWFSNKRVKPFFLVKGGALAFTQKALSPDGSYFQFSMQESIGVQIVLNPRWDLRLGFFGDFHFSNGYLTSYNPGLDVMNSSAGLSYHFRPKT